MARDEPREDRQARLGRALRDNLRRRKAQERGRAETVAQGRKTGEGTFGREATVPPGASPSGQAEDD